jgi:hypothetical protein
LLGSPLGWFVAPVSGENTSDVVSGVLPLRFNVEGENVHVRFNGSVEQEKLTATASPPVELAVNTTGRESKAPATMCAEAVVGLSEKLEVAGIRTNVSSSDVAAPSFGSPE